MGGISPQPASKHVLHTLSVRDLAQQTTLTQPQNQAGWGDKYVHTEYCTCDSWLPAHIECRPPVCNSSNDPMASKSHLFCILHIPHSQPPWPGPRWSKWLLGTQHPMFKGNNLNERCQIVERFPSAVHPTRAGRGSEPGHQHAPLFTITDLTNETCRYDRVMGESPTDRHRGLDGHGKVPTNNNVYWAARHLQSQHTAYGIRMYGVHSITPYDVLVYYIVMSILLLQMGKGVHSKSHNFPTNPSRMMQVLSNSLHGS